MISRSTLRIGAIVGLLSVGLSIVLSIVVIVCWKKKRQVEYKYHQLINEQEQPTEL
jgi:hypothetical protein